MVSLQDSRLKKERLTRLRTRVPVLIEAIHAIKLDLPLDALVPDLADVLVHPVVQKIIHDTSHSEFTISHLDPMRAIFQEISLQWQHKTESQLTNMISSVCGRGSFDRTRVLHLATTVFSCDPCGHYNNNQHCLLQYPRVLVHRHATEHFRDYYQWRINGSNTDESDISILRHHFEKVCWGTRKNIGFWKDASQILSELLIEFGYDPKTTTVAEMDAVDPIFNCVSCNLPREGRATMRWRMVVSFQITLSRDHTHSSTPLYEL